MKPHEENAINRVMKAWGLGSIHDPGSIHALAWLIIDHQHYTEILRACEPELRREMYEALSPNLRFKAKPLEDYVIAAKEQAEARELPIMDESGNLRPYHNGRVVDTVTIAEIILTCSRCGNSTNYMGERKIDAIYEARKCGWAYDELGTRHICPACLDVIQDIALD